VDVTAAGVKAVAGTDDEEDDADETPLPLRSHP